MSRKRNKKKLNSTTILVPNVKDIFDERTSYYTINKRILCYSGLWPEQSLFQRSIIFAFILLYTFSLFVPQILQLIKSWGNAASFIDCYSPLATNFLCGTKMLNFAFHLQKVRYLLDGIRDDWKFTLHLPELKILHEHGWKGMRFTIAYLMVYTAVAAWSAAPLIPIVMDMIVPLNESRPHIKYFAADYLVDPDKYFYPIYLHGFTVTLAGMLIYVGIDTFFMVISQHICAMLNILRYRFENMAQVDNEGSVQLDTDIQKDLYNRQKVACVMEHERAIKYGLDDMAQADNKGSVLRDSDMQKDWYYFQIVACLMEHKRVMRYIGVMATTCQSYLLVLVGMNMLSISCTCSQVVAQGTSTEDRLRFILFTVALVFHLFCITLPGQWIMETSSLLPDSAYCSNWYLMSPRVRKLIVLYIRRTAAPCLITAGKMYVMSMENFCGVMQTSMSYMTLLTSTQ